MIVYAIDLFVLSVAVLAVGMFKPKWILFWMDNPPRIGIQAISIVLFMIGAVLYGEGIKQRKAAEAKQAPVTNATSANKPAAKQAIEPAPAVPADTPTNDLKL